MKLEKVRNYYRQNKRKIIVILAASILIIALISIAILENRYDNLKNVIENLAGLSAILLIIILIVQMLIMNNQTKIFETQSKTLEAQTQILNRQIEINERQEKRYKPSLQFFYSGLPRVHYDEKTSRIILVDTILIIFNTSLTNNLVTDVKIVLRETSPLSTLGGIIKAFKEAFSLNSLKKIFFGTALDKKLTQNIFIPADQVVKITDPLVLTTNKIFRIDGTLEEIERELGLIIVVIKDIFGNEYKVHLQNVGKTVALEGFFKRKELTQN